MKYTVFVCLIFIALMVGCKKVPPNLTSTITGIVFDNNMSLPIPNAKVTVNEYKAAFYGVSFVGLVGAATSGPDGKYALKFTTTGKGDEYRINCTVDSTYLNLSDFNITKLKAGKDTIVNFSADQLFILQAHVIIKNYPAPAIWITSADRTTGKVYGTNKDTVVNLWVIPNAINGFQYDILVPGDPYVRYIFQSFTLTGFSNPYHLTLTIDPSTFPKRQ